MLTAMFGAAWHRIGMEYGIVSALVSALSEAALLTLPYIFLPRRWRWTIMVPGFIVAASLLVNAWYFPYFGDIMPPRNFLMASTVDNTLVECSLAAMKWTDLLIALPMPAALAVFIWRRKSIREGQIAVRGKIAVTAALLCLCLAGPAKAMQLTYKSLPSGERSLSNAWKAYTMPGTAVFTHTSRHGYIGGYITYASINENIELTDADRREILLAASREPAALLPEVAAQLSDAISANHNKNLIFILVESLSTSSLDRTLGGRRVTPCLDSLMAAPGVIAFPRIYSQVGPGKSSDGQFIYNTGILPLYDMPLVSVAARHPFPSLARELRPAESIEIIGENRALWFHDDTNRSYGFTRLIDKAMQTPDGHIVPPAQRDSMILARARAELPRLRKPFFAMVITLGMHGPYKPSESPGLFSGGAPGGMGAQEYSHHEYTALFDSELKSFLGWLRDEGLYDNSLIVITGDHTPHRMIGEDFAHRPVPLLILNSGIELKSDLPAGQIDLYPTLLDLTGRLDSASWRGLGHSLLRSRPLPADTTAPADTAMVSLSRKIILGNAWEQTIPRD